MSRQLPPPNRPRQLPSATQDPRITKRTPASGQNIPQALQQAVHKLQSSQITSTQLDRTIRSGRHRESTYDSAFNPASASYQDRQVDDDYVDEDEPRYSDEDDFNRNNLASTTPEPTSNIPFNLQGNAIGHPTGVRDNGQRVGSNGVGVQPRDHGNGSNMAIQQIDWSRRKYDQLSYADREIYDAVKARMWFELGLFQGAFPANTHNFMIKIWGEGIAENTNEKLARHFTPAESICNIEHANIPYKVSSCHISLV